MIKNWLKNICLISFALVGPITLPAGGIQRSLNEYKIINNTRENDGALGTTIQVGPLSITGHTVSGTTAYSFTSSELIYPIYTGWYGFLEINLEWTNDPDLQYQLDNTSTAVF